MRGVMELLSISGIENDSDEGWSEHVVVERWVRGNAEAVWSRGRNEKDHIGILWAGPVMAVNAGTMGSGLDVLVGELGLKMRDRGRSSSNLVRKSER